MQDQIICVVCKHDILTQKLQQTYSETLSIGGHRWWKTCRQYVHTIVPTVSDVIFAHVESSSQNVWFAIKMGAMQFDKF